MIVLNTKYGLKSLSGRIEDGYKDTYIHTYFKKRTSRSVPTSLMTNKDGIVRTLELKYDIPFRYALNVLQSKLFDEVDTENMVVTDEEKKRRFECRLHGMMMDDRRTLQLYKMSKESGDIGMFNNLENSDNIPYLISVYQRLLMYKVLKGANIKVEIAKERRIEYIRKEQYIEKYKGLVPENFPNWETFMEIGR